MRILRLDLARLRHFEDVRLELGTGLTIVHGDNEAGKTTALSAVRFLLFGFPDRAADYTVGYDQSALVLRAMVEFSSGMHCEVERKKKRGQTLFGRVVSGGDEVDDEWFLGKLGRPSPSLYERIFGFSLEALQQGSEALKDEDVQSAIAGTALGGAVNPGRVRKALREEKEKIFKEGGSKQLVASSLKRIDDLRRAASAAVTSAARLRELEGVRDRARAEAATCGRELGARRARARRLQADLDGLGPLARLEAAARELAALGVPVGLRPEHAAAFEQAAASRDTSLKKLEVEREERAALLLRRDGSRGDLPLLAAATQIENAFRGLDTYRRALVDLPAAQEASRVVAGRAQTALASLVPGWTLAQLEAAHLDDRTLAGLEDAVAERQRLDTERRLLDDDVRAVAEELTETTDRAQSMVPPPHAHALAPIEEWLAGWSGHEAARQQAAEADGELAALARKRAALRRRLDPPASAPEPDPVSLPAPRPEEVTVFVEQRRALEQRGTRLAETAALQERAVDDAVAALARATREASPPAEEDLVTARTLRDRGFRLVAARLDGEPDAAAEQAFVDEVADGSAPARSLQRAAQRAIARADDVVDRMRHEAEAVERRAQLQARKEEAEAQLETTRQASASLAGELALHEARWAALWQRCSFLPLAPAAMRGWLDDRDALVELDLRLAERSARRDVLRAAIAAHVVAGQAVLDAPGVEEGQLRRLARQRLEAARQLAEARAALEARVVAATAKRSETTRKRQRLQERAAAVDARLVTASAALGLPGEDAAGVARTARALAKLRLALQTDRDAAAARLARARDDVEQYQQQLTTLAVALGNGTGGPEPRSSPEHVEWLHARLVEARRAEQVRLEAERSLASLDTRVAHLERELDERRLRITELHSIAEVEDDVGFRRVAARLERAVQLRETVAEARRALAQLAELTLDPTYHESLTSASAESVEGELRRCRDEERALEAEHAQLHERVGAAAEQLRAVDGGQAAADAEAMVEAVRSELREGIERYAVLSLADRLLESAIADFERDHQPALLEASSRILAGLTDGRHSSVQRQLDGHLVILRQDGAVFAPEQLSTGTREQLFLAIRLAYVARYGKRAEPLPVVLDDVLVNFDDRRAAATLRALSTFAEDNQVLLFTCHRHLVTLAEAEAPRARVVELARR